MKKSLTVLVAAIIGLSYLSLGGYALWSTETEHYFQWIGALTILLTLTQLLKNYNEMLNEGQKVDLVWWFISLPLATFVGILVAFLSLGLFAALKDLAMYLYQHPSVNRPDGKAALVALTLGYSFYYFKLHARFVYGTIEVMLGVILAFYKHPITDTNINFYIAFLAGSVYLVARGFDNIQHGISDDKLLKYLAKIKYRK